MPLLIVVLTAVVALFSNLQQLPDYADNTPHQLVISDTYSPHFHSSNIPAETVDFLAESLDLEEESETEPDQDSDNWNQLAEHFSVAQLSHLSRLLSGQSSSSWSDRLLSMNQRLTQQPLYLRVCVFRI